MPTAELIKPKSYNTLGRIWRQGEVVDVTDEVAAVLADNPRFAVRDAVQPPVKIVKKPGKPTGEALSAAIRTAADQLDPDNESALHRERQAGMPCARGSAGLCGHRRRTGRRLWAEVVFQDQEGKLTPPAEAKSETVSHLPAEDKAVPATDPTTLNAIEVN